MNHKKLSELSCFSVRLFWERASRGSDGRSLGHGCVTWQERSLWHEWTKASTEHTYGVSTWEQDKRSKPSSIYSLSLLCARWSRYSGCCFMMTPSVVDRLHKLSTDPTGIDYSYGTVGRRWRIVWAWDQKSYKIRWE